MEIRIDELAHRASVPSRTIRYYTQQGLLPPPTLRGRVGYYSDEHLERLRLIKELQEKRFLPLNLIRSLLKRLDEGVDLELMLAPLDMVYAPRFGEQSPVALTREQLAAEAGVDTSVVDAADEMGFLFPIGSDGDLRYTQDDVHMLEIAQEWMRLGLPKELGRLYRESFERIARAQVRAFGEHVAQPLTAKGLGRDELREELVDGYKRMATTVNRLVTMLQRKLVQKAVEAAFTKTGPVVHQPRKRR